MSALFTTFLAVALTSFPLLSTPAHAGALDLVEVQRQGQADVEGVTGVMAVAISKDGAHLYAAGESEAALAVFQRDPVSGTLTQVDVMRNGVGGVDGLEHVSDVTLSPDGHHLYAVSTTQNSVAAFSRDATSGRLAFIETRKDGVGGVDGLEFARAVVVSPDGNTVYVAGQRAAAIAVFKRNTFSGGLTYLQTLRNGVDGVDGLGGVVNMTFSPDGRHLYAAGMSDGAVTAFKRNRDDGTLTFIEALKDNPADPQYGILGTAGVAVSPDGRNVYVTGQTDDSLAVFSRNTTSGKLKFVTIYAQGLDDADGLYGALAIAVSPDGTRVFMTGLYDSTVAAFARNRDGQLAFLERHKNMEGATTCLAMARALAVSPDGKFLYVAGASSSAVNVFRIGE